MLFGKRFQESEFRYLSRSVLLEESGNPVILRIIIWFTCGVIFAFFLWAVFMEIDEVAIAPGDILPSGEVQKVQHLKGGIISKIFVKDGDAVEAGQVLIQLDPIVSESQLEQTKAQMKALLLQKERLETFIEFTTINAENEKIELMPFSEKLSIKLLKKIALCGIELPEYGEETEVIRIRRPTVNLRAQPDSKSNVKIKLHAPQFVWQLDEENGWLKVVDQGCNRGWIIKRLTSPELIKVVRTTLKSIPKEPDFSKLPQVSPQFIEEQQRIFQQQTASYISSRSAIHNQISQLDAELQELTEQKLTLQALKELFEEEVAIKKDLVEQGIESKMAFLSLKRKLRELIGEIKQIPSQIQQNKEKIKEMWHHLDELDSESIRQASLELASINDEFSQVEEVNKRNEQEYQKLDLKAPVSGVVHGLKAHTVGGVLTPGDTILEIVPRNRTLMASVQISAKDIGHIMVGHKATVKFTTYNYGRYGGIKGTLQEISATTFLSPQGRPYYKGSIALEKNYIGNNPKINKVMSGMTVQADIKTGSKTVLAYLLKPIYTSAGEALRER